MEREERDGRKIEGGVGRVGCEGWKLIERLAEESTYCQ